MKRSLTSPLWHLGPIDVAELLATLAFFSALIWLSSRLQGPFSMSGSAAAFTLGSAFVIAFLRLLFLQRRPAIWFLAGAVLSTLWYPFAYAAIGSVYANGLVLSRHFCADFLLAFKMEVVYLPLLMLLGSVLAGGALDHLAKRLSLGTSLTG